MEVIATRIVGYLDTNKSTWNDLERMRMVLGLQVLIHNIVMIGTILLVAGIGKMFLEAVVLLTAYGALKMTAGGIHFKSSIACLLGTGIFIITGIMISRHIDLSLLCIIGIYGICLILLIIIGPQGTSNNPISKSNYKILRKRTIYLVLLYMVITLFFDDIPYLLFIAVVFETLSLLPSAARKLFW